MGNNMFTVIIVEYNSRSAIDNLIASIRKFETRAKVIISSNSFYTGNERERFDSDFSDCMIIHNNKNLGYAGGVNRALEQVTTPFTVILNPDVILIDSILQQALSVFEEHQNLGAFSFNVIEDNGESAFSGRRFLTPFLLVSRICLNKLHLKKFKKAENRYLYKDIQRDRFFYVDWISGGVMFVRMSAYSIIGGMDERYFLYFEDMDWCRTFWENSWAIGYDPTYKIIHNAQWESTKSSWSILFRKSTRAHLCSCFKYFHKWGIKEYIPSDKLNLMTLKSYNNK